MDEVDLDLGVLLDLGHRDGARVDAVHDLAVHHAARQVLDLAEARVEVVANPLGELLAADEVAVGHHTLRGGARWEHVGALSVRALGRRARTIAEGIFSR